MLLISAARPLRSLQTGLHLARDLGADIWVGASGDALSWLDRKAVEGVTGRPLVNDGEPLPAGSCTVCVAPATFNTLNKLASGVADTLVTAVAAEAIGAGQRVVVAPSMNSALMDHPVAPESRRRLVSYGVHLLWPETGNESIEDFGAWWEAVISECALA